jgi:hypothetical protein
MSPGLKGVFFTVSSGWQMPLFIICAITSFAAGLLLIPTYSMWPKLKMEQTA